MVSPGRKLLLGVAPQPQGLLEIGRFHAEATGEAGGDADVLRHQRELEARGERAGEHLQRDLALGGVVAAGGGVHRLEHRLRFQAESTRYQQRLEAGEGAGRAKVVVQRFYRVPGAERADVEDALTHRF